MSEHDDMQEICEAYGLAGVHPAAEIFPLLTGREFEELCQSIGVHGLEEDIVLTHDNYLLDGRNRLRACYETGAQERFKRIDEAYSHDYVGYVVRLNLHRRHLSESQRAVVASRIANMRSGARTDLQPPANWPEVDQNQISQPRAAEMLNVSERSVRRVVAVEREAPDLIPQIERGDLTAGGAMRIVQERRAVPPATVLPPQPVPPSQPDWTNDQSKRPPVVTYNTGDNEWYTPMPIIELARETLGRIDLDPASSAAANSVVRANAIYTAQDDGLSQSWYGRVWMNPPYSSDLIGRFCDKLTSEYRAGNVSAAIVLVNNATETGWFRTLIDCASAVVFPSSRVRFWKPDGGPGAPTQGQAILYIGDDADRFLDLFRTIGWGANVNKT